MQNEFITAIGLAEWDEKVTILLEKYQIPENEEIDENADKYYRCREDNLINCIFIKDCRTKKQKAHKAEENFYLQMIEFDFDLRYYKKDIAGTDIPFGIDEKSDYAYIVSTIGEPHLQTDDYELSDPYLIKFWLLKKDNGEPYMMKINFVTETLKVDTLIIFTYSEETEQYGIIPHSYNPLER